MKNLVYLNLRWIIRDRILQALVFVGFFLIMLVPPISTFSMRQSQELAVILSQSFVSFTLLIFAISLGSTIVWRDIERRYSYSILSLPLERGQYILAKFLSVALFLVIAALVMCGCSFIAIKVSALNYPSELPIQWKMIALSIGMDTLKYILVVAIAVFITTVSTSFFMPFFTTIAIYLAGSSSQEVYEFINSDAGNRMGPVVRSTARIVYYLIPNLSSFDFKLQAVYPIKFDPVQVYFVLTYFVVYTTMALSLSIWVFSKRELT